MDRVVSELEEQMFPGEFSSGDSLDHQDNRILYHEAGRECPLNPPPNQSIVLPQIENSYPISPTQAGTT